MILAFIMVEYIPNIIQVSSHQLLETIFIMENSKSVDTIIGRIINYKEKTAYLAERCASPRYISDVQFGINQYKSLYYDRIPTDKSIAILVSPNSFPHSEFISVSIFYSFGRMLVDFLKTYQSLSRESAKIKRKENILKILEDAKSEIISHYSDAKSFNKIIGTFNQIEYLLKTQTDFSNVEIEFR